jgi:hypothetical protein
VEIRHEALSAADSMVDWLAFQLRATDEKLLQGDMT